MNLLGLIPIGINIFTHILLQMKVNGIKTKRGSSIGGWVAFLAVSLILYIKDITIFSGITVEVAFAMGIIACIGIILVFIPVSQPDVYTSKFFGPVFVTFTDVGILIGYFMSIVLTLFG